PKASVLRRPGRPKIPRKRGRRNGGSAVQWRNTARRRSRARSNGKCRIEHFKRKYGDQHKHLPVWMAVEIMAFGSVLTFYRGSPRRIKKGIASIFEMPERVFSSWLLTLNTVRNICAHHGRLWNREFGTAPMIPRQDKYPEWHQPQPFRNSRTFAVLTICKWCVDRIAPQSRWGMRLRSLLSEYPRIPLDEMGFPADWERSPIWAPSVGA
ncbi:MAG: Abi family protein, partial [Phycisphaerae bacterium]|nr:Abi family protein [Phycisphaerae bacterium]